MGSGGKGQVMHGPIVCRPMGLLITASCDTALDQTRVCSDASSTAMQCLRPLRHYGGWKMCFFMSCLFSFPPLLTTMCLNVGKELCLLFPHLDDTALSIPLNNLLSWYCRSDPRPTLGLGTSATSNLSSLTEPLVSTVATVNAWAGGPREHAPSPGLQLGSQGLLHSPHHGRICFHHALLQPRHLPLPRSTKMVIN